MFEDIWLNSAILLYVTILVYIVWSFFGRADDREDTLHDLREDRWLAIVFPVAVLLWPITLCVIIGMVIWEHFVD